MSDEAVAFFYCNGAIPNKRNIRFVLGSLLRQLIDQSRARIAISQTNMAVTSLYEKHRGCEDGPDLLGDMVNLLAWLASSYPSVYILIDGFDEISNTSQALGLIDKLRKMSPNMYLLVVSRSDQDIEGAFPGERQLKIEESMVRDDIEFYVKLQLVHDENLKFIKPSLKADIVQSLKRSRGMLVFFPYMVS